MSTRFISGERSVWSELTSAARGCRRADVAVAYLGKGGAGRLPLPSGSRLVVDASEPMVRAGATRPADLLKLVRRGVRVYSRPNLHAKVFVFGRAAFVGSANVSARSADQLCEAMIRTTDMEIVRRAREFVLSLCDEMPLGPEALRKRQKLYRPPRYVGPRKRGRRRPSVWLENCNLGSYPDGTEKFVDKTIKEARAKTKRRRNYELVETWCPGAPQYAEGDTLIMTDDAGRHEMVGPPARVVHVRSWRSGRKRITFTIVERPDVRWVALHRLTKQLGRGWKRRLARYGRLNRETAAALIAWWDGRM